MSQKCRIVFAIIKLGNEGFTGSIETGLGRCRGHGQALSKESDAVNANKV